MSNAEKFKLVFDRYATEIWALPEQEFLEWLNEEYNNEDEDFPPNLRRFKCHCCGREYYREVEPQWDEEFGFHYWEAECPNCGTNNEVNDCYFR